MTTYEKRFYGTLGEPDAHVAIRHTQLVVRGLLITAILATLLLMFFYQPGAYLAVIPVPLLWFLLITVGHFERHSRASVLRNLRPSAISKKEIDIDVEDAGLITTLTIAGSLAIGSFVVAILLYDVASVGMQTVTYCLLATFYVSPYLPLFFMEARREKREKLTRLPEAERDTGG